MMLFSKKYLLFLVIVVCSTVFLQAQREASSSNDCRAAILICGNAQLGINPDGVGRNEFEDPGNPVPTCYDFNAAQAWFKVEIATDGTFTFEIDPDDGVADYDFAVFGPTTDCNNLGPAIRCSSTNPQNAGVQAATGLNETETDVVEGPGPNGNGFLRQLDVLEGETYYIIVGLAVGSGGFSMNVGGTTTFPQAAFANDVEDIEVCDDEDGSRDGFVSNDFSNLDEQILDGQTDAIVSYHTSLNDANLGVNPIAFPFTNTSNPQEIFYRVERTDSQCADYNRFTLTVDDSRIDREEQLIQLCSPDPTVDFDFSTIIQNLVPNAGAMDITYHNTLSDAIENTNASVAVFTVGTTIRTVYIKVIDPTGEICDRILNVPIVLDNSPAITRPPALEVCDDNFNGEIPVNLRQQDNFILNGLNAAEYRVTYYETLQDQQLDVNRITSTTATFNRRLIYAAVTRQSTGCIAYTDFEIEVFPRPILSPQASQIICVSATTPLPITIESGFSYYEWSTGENGPDLNSIEILQPGNYTVTVTNDLGCQNSVTIEVLPSDVAVIDRIEIIDFQLGNNSVSITASGPGDYEFAVDGGPFQDNGEFSGLDAGFHEVEIRDINGCGSLFEEFGILDFQPFFTPNADGFNDRWTIDAISAYPGAQLFIYDRYGKLLKQLTSNSIGWDGTFNGNPLPSSTYWYTVRIPERPDVSGSFALKR